MDSCAVCGGQEFYAEAGYYFCKECQTQHESKREEVSDFRVDPTTRVRRTKIRKNKSSSGAEQIVGWTTWEQYNFIMIGLTNELIELGASENIKMTIVQLWATYLGKLEIAFTSTKEKAVPKLPRKYNKKDAQIIYGKAIHKTKKKRSKSAGSATSASSNVSSRGGSSKIELNKQKRQLINSEYDRYIQSQNSDTDALSMTNASGTSIDSSGSDTSVKLGKIKFSKSAKLEMEKVKKKAATVPKAKRKIFLERYVASSYRRGADTLTPSRLWAIIYIALRIHDEKIHLSDMLRFGREGHLSYYRLEHLLPPEVTLSKAEIFQLNPQQDISHKGMRTTIANVAKLVKAVQLPHPNLLSLIERYVTELQLPNGIFLYAERMVALSPPKMEFNLKSQKLPNYEARAMAFIIVIMKILFGLDGITEYEISRVIDRINTVGQERGELESRLFNFCEWQRYIECRRCILIKEHFPTKLRHDPHSTGSSHLYAKFIRSIQLKYEGDEPEINKFYNLVPKDLANMMKQSVERISNNMPLDKDVTVFPPSFTPQHTYLQELLSNPDKDLPSILRQNFSQTKIGYMLKPETLEQLAAECDIELHVVTASAHFMEKIVPVFEPHILPGIVQQRKTDNHNKPTRIVTTNPDKTPTIKNSDDPSEYLHRKNPGKILIDSKKQRLYNKSRSVVKNCQNNDDNDFEFDQSLSNGKLNIPNSDDEDEETPESTNAKENYNLILSNFERLTLRNKVLNPWEKRRIQMNRRKDGTLIRPIEKILSDTEDEQCSTQEDVMLVDDGVQEGCNNNPITLREVSEDELEIYDMDSNEILILSESINSKKNDSNNPEILTLFRPYKQFWLYRCTRFSHITPTHFRLAERDFPINFRWLLNECAHIIEMNVEELYWEVCLIENYYADILSPNKNSDMCKKYDTTQYRLNANIKNIKKMW